MSKEDLKPTTTKIYSWKTTYFVGVLCLSKLQEQMLSALGASLCFDMYASCNIFILLRASWVYF